MPHSERTGFTMRAIAQSARAVAAGLLLLAASPARAGGEATSSNAVDQAGATNDILAVLKQFAAPYTNYASMLDNDPIYIPSTGRIDVAFGLAREIAPDFELVAKIAESAVDSSFRLRRQEGGKYRFTNIQKEDCDIVVMGNSTSSNRFITACVAEGERFFGKFSAIILVDSRQAPDGRILFDVHLYGYPHSAIWRFVARNFGSVQQYFLDRVMAVMRITTRTYECLGKDPARITEAMDKHQVPGSDPVFSPQEVALVRDLLERFKSVQLPPDGTATNPPATSPAPAETK